MKTLEQIYSEARARHRTHYRKHAPAIKARALERYARIRDETMTCDVCHKTIRTVSMSSHKKSQAHLARLASSLPTHTVEDAASNT